jgi:hypothetical protein
MSATDMRNKSKSQAKMLKIKTRGTRPSLRSLRRQTIELWPFKQNMRKKRTDLKNKFKNCSLSLKRKMRCSIHWKIRPKIRIKNTKKEKVPIS